MFAEFTRTYTKDSPPPTLGANHVIAHLRHYSLATYESALIILKPDNPEYTVGSLLDDNMTGDGNTRRLLQHFLPACVWSNLRGGGRDKPREDIGPRLGMQINRKKTGQSSYNFTFNDLLSLLSSYR